MPLEMPVVSVLNPIPKDVAIYRLLDSLVEDIAPTQGSGRIPFAAFVDDPKDRQLVARVAKAIGWPLPHRRAEPVTTEEKAKVLFILHAIHERFIQAKRIPVVGAPERQECMAATPAPRTEPGLPMAGR